MTDLHAAGERLVREDLHRQVAAIAQDLRELADRIDAEATAFDRASTDTTPTPYGYTAGQVQKHLYTTLHNSRFHTLTQRAAEADVYRALAQAEETHP